MGAEGKEGITDLSPVLVAVLEIRGWRQMRLLVAVLALLFFAAPAYAFEIPFTDIKILEPSEPIGNRAIPVLVEPALNVEKVVEDRGIVDSVTRFVGINKNGDRNITIYYEGKVLAFFKEGSKFDAIQQVHETCLKHQYGTESWYGCERRYQ